MDNQYVRKLRIQQKSVGKRLYAVVCLMLVTSLLLSTASYAWLVLSRAPEATGVSSNIGANGNLEIALGKNIGASAVGDSSNKIDVKQANRTWGNIIDLTDESYGLQEITLRPAILNAAGGAVNTLHPLAYPVYGSDGRVKTIYANNVYAGVFNGLWFTTAANAYGVRGIGAATYVAPGLEDTFGPLSQRQKTYYYACNQLWGMSQSSYESLCSQSHKVLAAYCEDGTGISAADFDLDAFAEDVADVIASANEELRLNFTILAAAEMTPSENYFTAMDLMQAEYPDYGEVRLLVDDAITAMNVPSVGSAIEELHQFRTVLNQLNDVIASGEIDGSDGYSMEEIARTVGLIFDLEKTSFTENGDQKNYYYYSSVQPELVYHRYTKRTGNSWYWAETYDGCSISNLTSYLKNLYGRGQDNDSREAIADYIIDSHINPLYNSLRLAELDQAIAELYASHWNYWDAHAEEYQQLTDETEELEAQVKSLEESIAAKKGQAGANQSEISALEAELQVKTEQLEEKNTQLETLLEEKVYAADDIHLETIRSVMEHTVEAMRKYTLWSIAYFACDGQVPDDAYHRMQEIAESSAYIHPRTAYQALCSYGVNPADALTQMMEAYEKLERELLFLQGVSGDADTVTWPELSEELQRVFGTITHTFSFHVVVRDDNGDRSYAYSSAYSPEDNSPPTETMKEIREEIKEFENAKTEIADYWYTKTEQHIWYGSYEENQVWAQSLGLLYSLYSPMYAFDYGESVHIWEGLEFDTSHDMYPIENYWFDLSIGVGSEDNFNESGLTTRQTRFQKAQENISLYQNQLITSAVNADKNLVDLLMQIIAGQSSVSIVTISDYLDSLQLLLEDAESMMYQAALAMAASNYAEDTAYRQAYSDGAPRDAAGLIDLLRQKDFDEKVLTAFDHRMALLNNQEILLNQAFALLKNYQDPKTGALTVQQIPAAEAAALLNPVLDTASLTLYGYVEEEQEQAEGTNATLPPSYLRTVLYAGFGSPAVQINGSQAVVGGGEPIAIFGDVYLTLGSSLSGSLLALAKTQVETYTVPAGSMSPEDIADAETGMNRCSYAMGAGENMYTLNLRTADESYAMATNLWNYTGNTDYISANNFLVDLYGYCIDFSLRTNAADSDLLLQTEAANRIFDGAEAQTETTMGAGSYMQFAIEHPSYSLNMAKEYMSCIRVVITDTNTGYIYGYAALDLDAAEVIGVSIKAPLRLYDKSTGIMLEGDAAQYICHLEQNREKNLTVYVYLDGAKATDAIVSAYTDLSLNGILNLQFCSSADLKAAQIDVSTKSSNNPDKN